MLISAWLNTNKDPVTRNEQKDGSFWKIVEAYFNASHHLVGMPNREVGKTVSKGGPRSVTKSPSLLARYMLQQISSQVGRMTMM